MNMLQQIQRADWAFGCCFKAGFNAVGMKIVETEKRSDLVSFFDVIVTDGALSDFWAIILGFEQTWPVLFYGVGIDFLGIDSELNKSLLNEDPSVGGLQGMFAQKPWDEITNTLNILKLKLALDKSEHIALAIDLAANPTLPNLYLVLLPFDFKPTGTVLKFDSILIATDGDIQLGWEDGDGGLVGVDDKSFGFLILDVYDTVVGSSLFDTLHFYY